MAPLIRVALIGLSDHSWAAHSHFPALAASPDFEIIGLCNSSVAKSQAAIEAFKLPESVKCYASPEEVANDADVDLVVCSTRVDRHLPTIGPSLKAGKNVYVEWPLGKNSAEARELARLKNEGGVKIATVGLQARQAPIIKKLKELVDGGRVGKVLSSTYTAQGSQVGEGVIEGSEYLAFTESGGNLVTIRFGHQIDYVQQVLGYGFSSQYAILANRRPEVGRRDQSGKLISEFTKTADDTVYLVGTLKNGIPFSFSLNGAGKPFKGVPGLEWRIYGEKGELRVTAASPFLPACDDEMKIELYDFAADTVESVDIPKDEVDASSFHWVTRNVARVYRALAKGEVNCSFEDAVERQEFLAELFSENGYFEY